MKLFFRNDDLGARPDRLSKLLNLFAAYGYKLNVALIPITCEKVYDKGIFQQHAQFIQVHTHGYANVNHQTESQKKSEYPLRRRPADVKRELEYGKAALERLFQNLYFPAFTPPWSSIADTFIPLLPQAGYRLLSRRQEMRAKIPGLAEINIDFELRPKEQPSFENLRQLWDFFHTFAEHRKSVGILLHHEYLEDTDFELIKAFFEELKKHDIATRFLSEFIQEE